jgi:cardiolipin synthase
VSAFRLIGDGGSAFTAIFAAIEGAGASIHLEVYLLAADATGVALRDRLAAAARRGVKVMVLADAWGSWTTPDGFWAPLRAAGAEVRLFHPIRRGLFPFRNHRKLLLVDDRAAWLGGMNVGDEYRTGKGGEPPWRDNLLEIVGPDALRLKRQFLRMWARADRPLRPRAFFRRRRPEPPGEAALALRLWASGPGEPERYALAAYRDLIRGAARAIDLSMSYFFPPGRILRELRRAVRRGVRVRLLLSRRNDVAIMRWAARGLYGRLLRAGVEIWEYLPTMLHAKLAVADDTLVLGSANLDLRSDRLNYELVAAVRDPGLAEQARREYEADLAQAVRVDLASWHARPYAERLKERVSYWLVARLDIILSRVEIFRSRW